MLPLHSIFLEIPVLPYGRVLTNDHLRSPDRSLMLRCPIASYPVKHSSAASCADTSSARTGRRATGSVRPRTAPQPGVAGSQCAAGGAQFVKYGTRIAGEELGTPRQASICRWPSSIRRAGDSSAEEREPAKGDPAQQLDEKSTVIKGI
jgi:hypothetical protein